MERLQNESNKDLKIRRKKQRLLLKAKLKGFIFWNSSVKGTYIRPKKIKTI